MDPLTNEDASRILRGMLNIGQSSGTDNVQEDMSTASLAAQIAEESDSLKGELEITQGNVPVSFNEQDTPRISLDPVHQVVYLTGDEQKGSTVIYAHEVHITTNEIETERPASAGSNRVRINPVVNFDWESKYYNGNLLSVSSKYMCYALKGKSGFVLRILDRKTLLKVLIKGFTGRIEDVSFAHYKSDLLACTDSAGDIFVWTIYEENNKINYELKLHVKRGCEDSALLEGNRMIWCPHIDDGVDENISEQILAVTCGDVAEVLHIAMITETYGNAVDLKDIKKGVVRIANGHTQLVADLALAPDGSVLATASEDGHVKFWTLDFDSSDSPRCPLHEWQPHEGKPLSRLIFCDSHLPQDDKNPFWRFLLTGANHNSELKIWCTVHWTCLQTIRFQLPASDLCLEPLPPLKFKASLDLSAKYLVLSDINRKVLYVFLLHEDLEQGKAHVTSVAHFILTQPLLSFVITEAKMFKASVTDSMEQNWQAEVEEKKDENHDEEEEEEGKAEGSQEDAKLLPTIKIKLHCINPRSMEEMTVQYHPFASVPPVTPSSVAALSMTSTEAGVQDGLSDMSGLDTSSTDVDDADPKFDENWSKPKLVAPNAFTTSIPQTAPSEATSSITSVTSINNSFGSQNIDDLLGKSASTKISESTCTFNTCEDDTLREPSSKDAEGFSPWKTGLGSPLVLPLPESPDPAKVPFPAFTSDTRGHEDKQEPGAFSLINHSTPKVSSTRWSHDDEKEEDAEKTPKAECGTSPGERDVTPKVDLEVEVEIEKGSATEPEDLGADERRPAFGSLGDSLVDTVRHGSDALASGNAWNTDVVEATRADVQQSAPGEQNLGLTQTPRHDHAHLLQARKARSTLEVMHHSQVNIAPEDRNVQQRGLDDNAGLSKLDEILSILRAQQTEIEQVKRELQSQERQQNQRVSELLTEEIAMLESAVSSKVETILTEHAREQDQRFDRFVREKQTSEKQKQDKLLSTVTTTLSNKVEKTMKTEMKNSASSGFQKLMVSMQDQIDTTMAQKLTAVDAVLKESIQKMVKDKHVVDAIGNAVSNAIHTRLQVSLSEFLTNSMLPGFEKACQTMYNQVNVAFQKGTNQYLRSFESHVENQKELHKEQRDPIVQQLQSLVQAFQSASEKLSTSMSGSLLEMMQTQLTSSMKRLQSSLMAQLQEDLTKSFQETIQQEVRSAVLMNSMGEGANHTDPHGHLKRAHLRIQQLINAQDFGEAFQEALTAGDLGIVVTVCQACDPVALFNQDPCPLSQPILLSLIQQLSVNLSDDTELKHRYLEDAVLALDRNDPITREHVSTILDGLCQQIQITMQTLPKTDPSNSLQRPLKRLLMAARSLTK